MKMYRIKCEFEYNGNRVYIRLFAKDWIDYGGSKPCQYLHPIMKEFATKFGRRKAEKFIKRSNKNNLFLGKKYTLGKYLIYE